MFNKKLFDAIQNENEEETILALNPLILKLSGKGENYQDIKQELWITAIESFRKIEANSEVKFHQYLKRLNVVENMSVNE